MSFDASLALRADGLLGSFNRAGILSAADVHVASRLGAIAGESSGAVLLAVALVVRFQHHPAGGDRLVVGVGVEGDDDVGRARRRGSHRWRLVSGRRG